MAEPHGRAAAAGVIHLHDVDVLLKLAECGFERLRSRGCQGMEKDKVQQVAFGSGLATAGKAAMEAIHFYWQKLRLEAGGLLVARRRSANNCGLGWI